jgi:hypothetical protein
MRRVSFPARVIVATFALLVVSGVDGDAQWLNYRTPGVPRTADGKVDLAAPAPRTSDGKPDLSGVWKSPNADRLEANIAQGPNAGAVQPSAQALFDKRLGDVRADSPRARCLPLSVPFHNVFDLLRIVQTPALTVVMYEAPNSVFRTVFTDGRELPADPNPTWLGYSIGRWDGDTLVITSSGFNDLGWLDFGGHPQSSMLRLTERLHRRDFGHIDVQMTLDDPKVFTRPITVATQLVLQPDTELLESFCDNERDLTHFTKSPPVTVPLATLNRYAGTYRLPSGKDLVLSVSGGSLIVAAGISEPALPLQARSAKQFVSGITATGFEFVTDATGNPTEVIIRTADSQLTAVRKESR